MFAPPLGIFRAVGFRIGGFKKVAEAPGDDVVSAPDTCGASSDLFCLTTS